VQLQESKKHALAFSVRVARALQTFSETPRLSKCNT